MKRRNFIYTGIGIAAGIAAGALLIRNDEATWKKNPLFYPYILSAFLDDESLRIIGTSYRTIRTDENSKVKLLAILTDGMNAILIHSKDPVHQEMEIEKRVEKDFKSEKLLMIRGWVISETEARQCALLSLS